MKKMGSLGIAVLLAVFGSQCDCLPITIVVIFLLILMKWALQGGLDEKKPMKIREQNISDPQWENKP
ncbi:MAG: hypothetical protein MUO77_05750 [Anaerolineales bacterium]|nr:hypothetical protein [Anaerolineales bacterium]